MTEYEWLTCEDDSKMLRFLGEEFWSQKYSSIHFKQHLFDRKHSCDLIREVVGNPFRPIYHVKDYLNDPRVSYHVQATVQASTREHQELIKELNNRVLLPEWLTGDVYYFAANIVESRDYRDVDVLADLLEETGCDNEELIRHFRQEVKCHYCKAKGKYWKKTHDGSGPFPFQCAVCKTTGWLPKAVPCQPGCWALRLITGGYGSSLQV